MIEILSRKDTSVVISFLIIRGIFYFKNMINKHVPRGLKKCWRCGEYRGTVKGREINWGDYILRDEMIASEEDIVITCLCQSTLFCPKCKKNKIHRSMSMRYDEEDNSIWYRPCFASSVPCEECQKIKSNNKLKLLAKIANKIAPLKPEER